MSRAIKNLVDNALLEPDSKLNILYFGAGESIDTEIVLGSHHNFYSDFAPSEESNIFSVQPNDIYQNTSYSFNLIVCASPYERFQEVVDLAVALHLPVVFVHHKVPSIKKERLFQMGHQLTEFSNVVINDEIAHELHLYSSDINNSNWDKYFNALLYKE